MNTPTIQNEETLLKYVMSLIASESELTSKLEKVRREMKIYKPEIAKIQDKLHKKSDGGYLLISQMTDEHLLNYVKIMLSTDYDEIGDIPTKYLEEIKSRWLVTQALDMEERVKKDSDSDLDY